MSNEPFNLLTEIEQKVPNDLQQHLSERNGAAAIVSKLPQIYKIHEIGNVQVSRIWELIGLYYFNQTPSRASEALGIFLLLYQYMLDAQKTSSARLHKGMPLLWIAECYALLGYHTLRKRYLMLALCEDAITGNGTVSSESSGVYFRLVWRLGMGDANLQKYASEAHRLGLQNITEALFPEWVLQNMGQDWITEVPSTSEANVYMANSRYIDHLLNKVGSGDGKGLEQLAEYIMQCMPGCRTSRRRYSPSTDYDLICSMEGFDIDFRSELGRYFVCECKDWKKTADFTTMAKFCRLLDSVKCKFGILFSREGISGAGKTRYAEREQLKVFQDRGMVIVTVDLRDLQEVARGANLINLLRDKYERVRLDLDIPNTRDLT